MQQFDKKKLDEIGKALVKADAISAHGADQQTDEKDDFAREIHEPCQFQWGIIAFRRDKYEAGRPKPVAGCR